MIRHKTSGRTGLGLTLAAITMLAWATLPVALSALLRDLDPLTLTWFRFLAASVVLSIILGSRGSLPKLSALGPTGWLLLVLATLFLAANYLLFLIGLSLTTPANTQILMQLSPLLFSLGGITIFGERFERRQWLGFFILIGGLAVFCSDQLLAFVAEGERYLLGYAVILAAAFSWAVSLLIQKRLLTIFRSQALLLCIYVGCALCFTPLADPGRIAALSGGAILLLLYCALNTVVAYGAFSAALENVEASRAGAVIALSPVATFGFIAITHALFPGALPPEQFSPWMLFGAATVVIGSVITARG
ncbi:MAG: DMT family transporter [Myxococcales bacterium]|nr:DMT family transporter [Myxococcales bacterium]